jgi:type IV fimbrial biogenesis protein FimT
MKNGPVGAVFHGVTNETPMNSGDSHEVVMFLIQSSFSLELSSRRRLDSTSRKEQAMKTQRFHGGYTLIELLVVIGLGTGAMAWVMPVVGDLLNSARIQTGAQALGNSLALARSEAIKRNGRVVMCKSSKGESCARTGGWEQGWLIFHDLNNNAQLDEDEDILHREAGIPSALSMHGNTPVSHYVSYTPYGRTKQVSGAFQAGTFTVCGNAGSGVKPRQVVINSVGRARVAQAAASVCA